MPIDYVSPGLKTIRLAAAFPLLRPARRNNPVRPCASQIWRTDQRWPECGVVSVDEAHILYNTARQFVGYLTLEIGCWIGWSTAHLAAGGARIEALDVALCQSEIRRAVTQSMSLLGFADRVTLVGGISPYTIDRLAAGRQRPWSLFFIDANHTRPSPYLDTDACLRHAHADAMILYHDLLNPDVHEGLILCREQGWNTGYYDTMDIIGVAWRGDVQPIAHQRDPQFRDPVPAHLRNERCLSTPTN